MAGTVEIDICTALLEVQRLDTVLDELAQQSANFPHKSKVAQIAQKAAEGKNLIAKLQAGIDKIESKTEKSAKKVEKLNKKIKKDQKELDAGTVDYRQVGALTDDIAAHTKRIEHEESEQIKLLETKYSARDRIADYQQKIDELEAAKERTLAAYREQMAALAAKTVQVSAARDIKRALVTEELLARYDDLRAKKGGTVVGVFDGTRCLACMLKLPTALAEEFVEAGDVGTCSECRRILVYLGDEHEE